MLFRSWSLTDIRLAAAVRTPIHASWLSTECKSPVIYNNSSKGSPLKPLAQVPLLNSYPCTFFKPISCYCTSVIIVASFVETVKALIGQCRSVALMLPIWNHVHLTVPHSRMRRIVYVKIHFKNMRRLCWNIGRGWRMRYNFVAFTNILAVHAIKKTYIMFHYTAH